MRYAGKIVSPASVSCALAPGALLPLPLTGVAVAGGRCRLGSIRLGFRSRLRSNTLPHAQQQQQQTAPHMHVHHVHVHMPDTPALPAGWLQLLCNSGVPGTARPLAMATALEEVVQAEEQEPVLLAPPAVVSASDSEREGDAGAPSPTTTQVTTAPDAPRRATRSGSDQVCVWGGAWHTQSTGLAVALAPSHFALSSLSH